MPQVRNAFFSHSSLLLFFFFFILVSYHAMILRALVEVRDIEFIILSSSISRVLDHCRNSTYLQIRARISPLPVAKRLLVGLGATEMTVPC